MKKIKNFINSTIHFEIPDRLRSKTHRNEFRFKPWKKLLSLVLVIALALAVPLASHAAPGDTTRVSLMTLGPTEASRIPTISADGRYVAFYSEATNLVSGDTNGEYDIFVRDTQSGMTARVSLATGGAEGNDDSSYPSISADGRYVAFHSEATNLVSGDTNGRDDIFVRDTQTGTTTRVSLATGGAEANHGSRYPAISADGRYVAFESGASNLVSGDTNGVYDIFVRDIISNTTVRVSLATGGAEGNDHSYDHIAISADGRYVAFKSWATNLVSGDTNERDDIFVHDTHTGATTRASLTMDGAEGNNHSSYPAISADGRYVAFTSYASNLVIGDTNGVLDIFVRDINSSTTVRVSRPTGWTQGNDRSFFPAISADGRYVTFESDASNLVGGDSNGSRDIFVRDTQANTTTRVSLATDGTQGDASSISPSISADGRYVVFLSGASNLVSGDTTGFSDIYMHDTQSGTTVRVLVASHGAEGDGKSSQPAISVDGRYVAFESDASNLVSGDKNGLSDIYVYDTRTGMTTRVSLATDGTEGDGVSSSPAIMADGRYVAFESYASNLVSEDTNWYSDIYVHDTQSGTTALISLATDGNAGNSDSYSPVISNDGRYVAFESRATNLVSGDTNGSRDIFVRDNLSDTTTRVSLATNGTEGGDHSYDPAISNGAHYVAFRSEATNLVSGDTNGIDDIFVHDTHTGATTRVSLATDGTEGDGDSRAPTISADGRYVVFESDASNLVSGDTNGTYDIFVHDTQTGMTTRVSLATGGTEGNSDSLQAAISADGNYVAFYSVATNLVSGDTNGLNDIFVHDINTSVTTRASLATDGTEGNDHSANPAISADGRFVVFESDASNLVSGDTNGVGDVFVHENDVAAPIVTSLNDPGNGICNPSECTLREAVAVVAIGDTITFDESLSGGVITLGTPINFLKDLTIDGSGLDSQVQVSGGGSARVFGVLSGVTVAIDSLHIVDGSAFIGGGISSGGVLTVSNSTFTNNSAGSHGGAIRNQGTLTITNSTFSGNSAQQSGGIANEGTLTISNSTFFANSATVSGGSITNEGTLTISNSTFSSNSAPVGGGILNSSSSTMHLKNTIVADSPSGEDCVNNGTLATNTNNLVEDDTCSPMLTGDPVLNPLADNGGPTETMALLPGSPAIDAGDNPTCESTDQRGWSRPIDGDQNGTATCDIGAYEKTIDLFLPLIMR